MNENRIKIAIHGSCCSREIFNSSLNTFDLRAHLFQNPIHTMFENPFPAEIKEEDVLNNSNFMRRMIASEFNKKALQTLANNPADYLMIDVGDLRLGRFNICFNNSTKTKIFKTNDTEKELSYLQNKLKNFDFDIESNKDIPEKEWDYLINRYVSEIKKIYSIDKIIFNRLAIAAQYEKDGTLINFTEETGGATFINKDLLLKLQNKLEKKLKGCLILDNPSFPIIADSNHKLGLHLLHLKQNVYDYKMKKLQEILMNKNNIITVKNAEGDSDTQAEILIQNKIDYTPKVSVIIPVYNVEEYLCECLDSVVNQTLKEIEIICIDDGSTDNSLEILKEYAQKDNRITVIKQENLYAGVARNVGIENAKGKYICFLDSDDFFNSKLLEKLFLKSNKYNVDICLCNANHYNTKTKNYISVDYLLNKSKIPNKSTFSYLDCPNTIYQIATPCPWGKIYKTSFVKKNKIRFLKLRRTEDAFFVNMLMVLAKKITIIDEVLISHRIDNINSLENTKNKSPLDFIQAYKKTKEELLQRKIYNKVKNSFTQMAIASALYNIRSQNDKESFMQVYNIVKNEYFNLINTYKYNEKEILPIWDYKDYIDIKKVSAEDFIKLKGLKFKKDKKTKVSIIMPCYNTATYLRQALDSAVNQTLKDIEIICVNDGSTDNTLNIIKEYAAKDNRIVVIDGPNGGYGKAMNKGLDRATGEYIGILEPDDYLKLDMYEIQYEIAKKNNLDFVKSDFYHFTDNSIEYQKLSTNKHNYNSIFKPMEKQWTFLYLMNTWTGIYKTNFIKQNNILYNETPGASFQDNGFFFQTFCFAERAMFIDKAFYFYRKDNPNSSINNPEKVYCMNEEYKHIRKILTNKGLFDKIKNVYEVKKLHNYLFTLRRINSSFKLQYTLDISKEFNMDKKEYSFDNSFFNDKELSFLSKIMTDPYSFYNQYCINDVKISIILPVYNVEKYLRECLNSIINQTFKNLEIICIDDGSNDRSYEILKEYAQKDKRIIILQQENKGAGTARNAGLKIATGDFLAFLDADDFFEHDMLEIALNKIQETEADFIIYNSNQFDDKSKTFINPNWIVKYDYFPNKPFFSYSTISGNIFQSTIGWAWDKLYRTSFVRKHNLYFQEQRTTNDALFVFSALFLANKISVLNKEKKLVHHRVNNLSSLENTRSKSWMCFYNMLIALKERLIKENKFNELEHDFLNYALHSSLWNLNTLKEPVHSLLKEKLQNEWFNSLGITSKKENYFENKKEYLQMLEIVKNCKTTTQSPLLFKDIGFGCKTWCAPKNVTGNDIKSFTYDLSDNIYIRYVSWDPIKEGSCDVEIKRLYAVEKRTKKIVEFPINKIISSGKVSQNRVEFRNQKSCWIGCTIEGAYESFTIEAKIKNI